MPIGPLVLTGARKQPLKEERLEQMLQAMEVANKHHVPIYYHTGHTMGYVLRMPETYHPLWAHDLASNFPDIPLIFDHGGIQGWWWEHFTDECLHVAASHDNVYMESARLLVDGPILQGPPGPQYRSRKTALGTDWGASIPVYAQPGRKPDVPRAAQEARRRHPSGGLLGLEPQTARPARHQPGRPEPDPRR